MTRFAWTTRFARTICLARTLAPVLFVAACLGSPPQTSEPLRPTPIDLTPRCTTLGVEGATAARAPSQTPPADLTPDLIEWPREDALSLRGWTVATPYAMADAVAWGFPIPPESASTFERELVALLLESGQLADDPAAFRERSDALAQGLRVHVENDWLWMEIRYPRVEQKAAIALLGDWLDVQRPAAEDFERSRRTARLASLAADADPGRIADTVFESMIGIAATSYEESEATSTAAIELLRAWLEANGSVLIHSSTARELRSESEQMRVDVEAITRARATKVPASADVSESTTSLPTISATITPSAIHIVDRPGAPQVEMLVGFVTVPPEHVDAPALEMLASLLGGNVGGRLFRDLRERQGLAYIIDAHQTSKGRFVVETRARHERVPALLVGIEAHLRALVETPLERCEYEALVDRMTGEMSLLADDPLSIRARLREEIRTLGRPRSRDDRKERYAQVRFEDLASVGRRHLGGQPVIVFVGEAARLKRDIARVLPHREVVIVER